MYRNAMKCDEIFVFSMYACLCFFHLQQQFPFCDNFVRKWKMELIFMSNYSRRFWMVCSWNRSKWIEMKSNEQMNPRRKIYLLLNHIFEKIYISLFMASNSCNFMFSFDKVLFAFIEFDLVAVTFAIAWVVFSIRDL